MGAGFESQWDAEWFRGKVEQCRSLAGSSIDPHVAVALRDLADEFEAQARKAEQLTSEKAQAEGQ